MTLHLALATCRTDGCGNAGIPIPIAWDDSDGLGPPSVTCGVCSVPITDVTPDTREETPDE